MKKSGLIQKLRWWLIQFMIGKQGVVANVTIYGELHRDPSEPPFLAWRTTFRGYDQAPGFVNKEREAAIERWAAMSEKYEALRAAVRQVGELSGQGETMDSHLEIYHGMER